MSSRDTPKTILLSGDPITREGNANGSSIKPGMLISGTPDGDLVPHATAAERTAVTIALENEADGTDIDTAYADNERVRYANMRSGDQFYGFLSAGNDVSADELLQSDGAGAFEKLDTAPGVALVRAIEAVDNDPGSGGAAVRIKLEVL